MRIRINKTRSVETEKVLLFFSVLFVVYLTDSLLFATINKSFFLMARRVLPIMIALVLLIRYHYIDKTVLFVCVSIFFSMLKAGRLSNGFFYYSQIGVLLFGYVYAKYHDFDSFIDMFIVIMRIIIVFSLIAFSLSRIISSIPFIPTITNSSGNRFKFLFFTNVPVTSWSYRRNWGPFWEPGVFQYYINLSILFSFFRRRKGWYIDIIIFLLADLTTLSGAAILPLPFILLAYILNDESINENKRKFAIILSLVFFVFVLMSSGYFDEISAKITGMEGDSNSRGYRLGSMIANLKAAITHPLFGASPEYQDSLRVDIISQLNDITAKGGNTNTVLGFFSYFGFVVGFYFTKRIYSISKLLTLNPISRICIFIAIFLMTSNENLMQSLILFVLMFSEKKDL